MTPGNPGNKGGGRKPDELRRLCREVFPLGVKRARDILNGKVEGDALKAWDIAGKYGLGEAKVFVEDPALFQALASILPKYLTQEQCMDCLAELKQAIS